MTLSSSILPFFSLLIFFISISQRTLAGDPDILQDFIVPENVTADPNFFTSTVMRGIIDLNPANFMVVKASMAEFPALNGESVSFAILKFPGGQINPLHTHPRASELLMLIDGILEVGFVDTKNVLYKQRLKAGDMFVFPKGLLHYQYNRNHNAPATAISAFGSASAGVVSAPVSVFATGIDVNILANSFKTDVDTIEKIEAGIAKP